MGDAGRELGRGMRWLLLACGPMNAAGAVCFIPPFPHARHGFGLPEPDPFYLWVLAAWIAAFGVAFFRQGWTGRTDRAVLALAAWGKGVFAVSLVSGTAAGGPPHSPSPRRLWTCRSRLCSRCGCGGRRGTKGTPPQELPHPRPPHNWLFFLIDCLPARACPAAGWLSFQK